MNKNRIYISGAITNDPGYKDKFKEAEEYLKDLGWKVVNPAELVKKEESKKWSDYMREAVNLMTTCTAIYMLNNWKQSHGAIVEYQLATTLEYDFYYEDIED